MRYTPSNSQTNDNNSVASRKRRSETSEMFPSQSQETENRINHVVVDSDAILSIADVTNQNSKSIPPTVVTKIQLKVRIKRFHSVAHWTWGSNTKDDVCSICQNAFEGVCPGVKYPGEDCPVVWGKCLHAFHLQCINTWLTSSATTPAGSNSGNVKNSCPICRQEWEFNSSSNTPTTTDTAADT